MNKQELIAKIAEKSAITKKQATAVLEATLETISDTLAEGENVQLIGFGTFEVREREARTGINPRTKAPIEIPASKVPAFKAGAKLKEKVNK